MSIEDLMRIDITSVSRPEQHASDAAAAIYVITVAPFAQLAALRSDVSEQKVV